MKMSHVRLALLHEVQPCTDGPHGELLTMCSLTCKAPSHVRCQWGLEAQAVIKQGIIRAISRGFIDRPL